MKIILLMAIMCGERMCKKCGGSGYISKYKHIEDGKCFECNADGMKAINRLVVISCHSCMQEVSAGQEQCLCCGADVSLLTTVNKIRRSNGLTELKHTNKTNGNKRYSSTRDPFDDWVEEARKDSSDGRVYLCDGVYL
ncbi:hypothetical protein [Vibrio campbellii]|uniref:hypothetical protein n=1 Tax=Vibrio campbellii TaxID=680 RepID=UPI003F86810D